MSSNYRSGADLERATKKLFEANGYYVMKSGGSKGAADIIAIKPGELLLIQCKIDGYMNPAARVAFWKLGVWTSGRALAARWHKEGRAARRVQLGVFLPGGELVWHYSPDFALEAQDA